MRKLAVALASGLYLSFIPAWIFRTRRWTGAGFIGSAWGVLLLAFLPIDPLRQMAVWLGLLAISIVVSDIAETELGHIDDTRIVIDETIGQWTAILFLPRSYWMIALSFFLFRVFDVLKPGPIRKVGDLPGGWGVVMDDVLAGVAANLVLRGIQFIHPL